MSAARRGLLRHRELALALTRRELFAPFAGSAFGVAWALLHPLVQTLVYVAVFTFIFRIRFGEAEAGRLDAAAYMIAGLSSWMTWSMVLVNGCSSVIASAALVKQADFPSEVLPLRTVLAAMVPQGVMVAILMIYVGLRFGVVDWTWALVPVAALLQGAAMLGAACLLSSLCVFLRDAKEVVTVLVGIGIYLTPAFYLPSMVEGFPAPLRWALRLNPFTHFMNVWRDCLFRGEIRSPGSWVAASMLAVAAWALGRRAFDRLSGYFGNFV